MVAFNVLRRLLKVKIVKEYKAISWVKGRRNPNKGSGLWCRTRWIMTTWIQRWIQCWAIPSRVILVFQVTLEVSTCSSPESATLSWLTILRWRLSTSKLSLVVLTDYLIYWLIFTVLNTCRGVSYRKFIFKNSVRWVIYASFMR